MQKLKKDEFNEKYRFRISHGKLVTCNFCLNREEDNRCHHNERYFPVRLYEESTIFRNLMKTDYSRKIVCDEFKGKPFKNNRLELPKNYAILLQSQSASYLHTNPNCPYVIEERKVCPEGKEKWLGTHGEGGILIKNISEYKFIDPYAFCDMPNCSNSLNLEVWSWSSQSNSKIKLIKKFSDIY